jgi:hypothetical protein
VAIVRPDVKTKNAILRDNINGYVNWALDERGMNRARILAEMRRRYPNAPNHAIESAYDHILSSRASGRRQDRVAETEKLGRASIPINSNIPDAYRYYVLLEWTDASSGTIRYMRAIVDSGRAMTNAELREAAINQAEIIHAMSSHSNRRYQYAFPAEMGVTFTVQQVERRT